MLKQTFRPFTLAVLVLACAAVVVLAKIKVRIDHDPSFNFSTLRTWTARGGAGRAEMGRVAGQA